MPTQTTPHCRAPATFATHTTLIPSGLALVGIFHDHSSTGAADLHVRPRLLAGPSRRNPLENLRGRAVGVRWSEPGGSGGQRRSDRARSSGGSQLNRPTARLLYVEVRLCTIRP